MLVIIVGGGIAGLAAGAFLRERTNFTIEIYERGGPIDLTDNSPRRDDYGIAVAPNGVACLKLLGMDDPLEDLNGCELNQILFRTSDNPTDVPIQKYNFRALFGHPSVFCRRTAMIRWLAKKCIEDRPDGREKVMIHYHCKTIGIDAARGEFQYINVKSPEDHPIVQRSADLLICADGIEKIGRRAVLTAQEAEKKGVMAGMVTSRANPNQAKILQYSYMSVISPQDLRERPQIRFLAEGQSERQIGPSTTLANWYHNAPQKGMSSAEILKALQQHKRIVLYPIDRQGYHQMFAYGAMTDEILARFGRGPLVCRPEDGSSAQSTPMTSPTSANTRNVLRGSILHGAPTEEAYETFQVFHEEASSLLALHEEEGINMCMIRDSDPIDHWSVNGRTVLVGDGAHASVPHTGQGSSQALEDAETLSFILAKWQTEHSDMLQENDKPCFKEVFDKYEQVRIPKAHKAQLTARMSNGHVPGLEKMDLDKYNAEILLWKSTERTLAEIEKGLYNKFETPSSDKHIKINSHTSLGIIA
ncbi:FAD/NAD(P)-binding domain-containing protein [Meira miltonrushii]|uniref:FAD/NAD(P)-binding domain-containing protein n=1 Tax=Meira miltonrushii TaxID=1280837 RepID=A0A316VLS3_9BASI|nr:FAD/NAD(P)-binding domain-containing protein [Meira miltonrushii]PWN37051.1 FAD/NAD(P)-binding domain-containing protein [Meira miltonrushii]